MLNAPLLTAAVDAFKIPDLRRKLLFTLGMLVASRFIAHVPIPGADLTALQRVFQTNQLAGFFDLFSGGALSSLSVAALGVYPYITAQIIMQIMQPAIPRLQEIAKEGESGRQMITQYGVGQGVSIIIFGGIMARLPFQVFQGFAAGADFGALVVFGALAIITIVAIIYVYEGQRRIPVQISKQIRGNRVYGGGTTHIPLKVNSAGMIPLIFASSMLILPWTISSYFVNNENSIVSTVATTIYNTFNAGTSPVYWLLYFIMVVAFTFFYALVIFQQQNIAENLQRQHGFIPGIRPGRPTHQYLSAVLVRITVAGALFLGIVAVLPFFVKTATGFQTLTISSTAVLIVVGVALDTMRQLEAQLIMRNYRGFIGR